MAKKHLSPIEVPGLKNTGVLQQGLDPFGAESVSFSGNATLGGSLNNVYDGIGGHTLTLPATTHAGDASHPVVMVVRNESAGVLILAAGSGKTINGASLLGLSSGVCALVVGRGASAYDAYFLDPNPAAKVALSGNQTVSGNKLLTGTTTVNDIFLPAGTTSGFLRSEPHVGGTYGGFNKVFEYSTPQTYNRSNYNSYAVQLYTNNGTADVEIAVAGFDTINGVGTSGSGTSITIAPGETVLMYVSGPQKHEARWLSSSPGGGGGGSSAGEVPVGGEIAYYGDTEPSSGDWKFPNGQAISRVDYAEFYAMVGTTFGPGDGSTTFNIPDGRGRSRVQLDDGAGVLSGTDDIGEVGGQQRVTLSSLESGLPAHVHTASVIVDGTTLNFDHNHNETRAHLVNHYHAAVNTGNESAGNTVGSGSATYRAGNHYHTNGGTGYVAAVNGYAYGPETHTSGWVNDGSPNGTWNVTHAHTGTVTVNPSTAVAASSSHENMPPHIRVNKLLRVR